MEGWNRRISTCSSCERQKQFASGTGGFVVLVWDSSMVVMTIMIIVITTAVIASATSRIGVVSVIRVTCADNAGVPGS